MVKKKKKLNWTLNCRKCTKFVLSIALLKLVHLPELKKKIQRTKLIPEDEKEKKS